MDMDDIDNAGMVRALAAEGMPVEKISFMMRMSVSLIEHILANPSDTDEAEPKEAVNTTD